MPERLRPINDDDMLVVDTSNGDILGIQPRHKPDDRANFGGSGGLSGTVENNLLVVEYQGQSFALVPVTPDGAIEANLVPRTGTRSALSTLAGEPGEIGTITDQRGVMVFTGEAGAARGIYSSNAGRTLVVSVAPEPYTGPVVEIGPDVLEVIFQYTALPADPRDAIPGVQARLVGARTADQRLRVFQDYPVTWLAGTEGAPNVSLPRVDGGRGWAELRLDTSGTPAYRAISVVYCESGSSPAETFPGSVKLGENALAYGRNALALGTLAVANLPGEIAFGVPAYSDLRTNKVFRVGGQTTGVNGTAVLTPTGAAASDTNMFGFDLAYGASAFGLRLDIMGKRSNSAECVRFVREVVVQRTGAGALTLLQPATPNNPSDVLSGGMTGANVELSIASVGGGTNNSLQILVTGPNTSSTTRWSCVAYANVMGNG